ncbi:hypothetical protein, partial [Stenotrophomonas sp. SrG]|uniref:hypothetical protein n=1 Tax=Stenotrophomonas sp. SrG TaxID=3414430 RepID=UPI003CEE45C2
SFDRSISTESVRSTKFGSDVLDGKISSMALQLDNYIELFSSNNQADLACTHQVMHDLKFNMGEGQGAACPNDTARSALWHRP